MHSMGRTARFFHILSVKGVCTLHLANFERAECRAALGPISAAIRAERALLFAGIAAQVVALEPHETKKGCAFGITFSCMEEARVRATLRAAKISVSQYFKKG